MAHTQHIHIAPPLLPVGDREQGLVHDPAFLDALHVLQRGPADPAPVRALTAPQFADIHLRHLLSHPPDSVLFPFLHGLEGDNQAQNLFFASSSGDGRGHLRVPNFRGLVWVAADEPDADGPGGPDAARDSFDDDDELEDSSSDSDIDCDTAELSELLPDAFGMPMDIEPAPDSVVLQDVNQMPHMHPVHHRSPLMPSPSTATVTTTTATASGLTSTALPAAPRASAASTPIDVLDFAYPSAAAPNMHDRRPSDASYTTSSSFLSSASSLFDARSRSFSVSTASTSPPASPSAPSSYPQCSSENGDGVLTSSPQTTSPPPGTGRTSVPLLTSSFRPHELLKTGPAGLEPCFIPPRVPDGISLRNFGIQVPVYATLSDVVVYSTRGDVRRAYELALKFKGAIEAKAAERRARNECGQGADVRYNVFVLTARPDDMEEHLPHLLKRAIEGGPSAASARGTRGAEGTATALPAVEGLDTVGETRLPVLRGSLGLTVDTDNLGAAPQRAAPRANTVDFAQREKEEMRELTRASEIISFLPPPPAPAPAPSYAASSAAAAAPAAANAGEALPFAPVGAGIGVAVHPSPDASSPYNASTTAALWDPAVGQVFLGNSNDVPMYDAPLPAAVLAPRPIPGSPSSTRRASGSGSGAKGQAQREAEARALAEAEAEAEAAAEAETDDPFNARTNDPARGFGYDICIECHDMAPFPSSAHIRAAEDHLRLLDSLWAERCAAQSGGPDGAVRPPPNAKSVIHLPFPSSPPSTAVTVGAVMPFISFLERALQPVVDNAGAPLSSSSPAGTPNGSPALSSTPTRFRTRSIPGAGPSCAWPHRTRPVKVLVYSSDGYTESSVLALSMLMVLRGLALPESYLELQVAKRRSFFVYASDLGVLKRVEQKVAREREKGGALLFAGAARRASVVHAPAGAREWTVPAPAPPPAHEGERKTGRPASSTVSYAAGTGLLGMAASASAAAGASALGQLAQTLPFRRPRASTSPLLPSVFGDHQAWFSDPRFDGSFPSRVLPFLYLGNLNHASNAYMLHALGITHVVSVGECALVPPPNFQTTGPCSSSPNSTGGQFVAARGPGCHGSLWMEEREGRIKVLDIKGVCDDGIDSLEPQLEPVCDWIDRARAEGGQVLVHCRVGVSRSATVVIAYVMKHLNISLVDAYLIVRSRRLSVLIQPNMRLLYNLLGWEIKLARARAGDDPARLRAELCRSLNWPYLAKEVHALNEKYLH